MAFGTRRGSRRSWTAGLAVVALATVAALAATWYRSDLGGAADAAQLISLVLSAVAAVPVVQWFFGRLRSEPSPDRAVAHVEVRVRHLLGNRLDETLPDGLFHLPSADVTDLGDVVGDALEEGSRPARQVALTDEQLERYARDIDAGSVLVLGEPGVGKTTTALRLADRLLRLHDREKSRPLPVYLPAAGWERGIGFGEWLTRQLVRQYRCAPHDAEVLVRQRLVIPFVDGLNDFAEEHRLDCVAAMNDYSRDSGAPVVLCSWARTYDRLRVGLEPTVTLRLGRIPVAEAGAQLAKAGVVLGDASELRELARLPLWLAVMRSVRTSHDNGSGDGGGLSFDDLWIAFIEARYSALQRSRLPLDDLVAAMQWLAYSLGSLGLQVVRPDALDDRLVEDRTQRWVCRVGVAATAALLGTLVLVGLDTAQGLLAAAFCFGASFAVLVSRSTRPVMVLGFDRKALPAALVYAVVLVAVSGVQEALLYADPNAVALILSFAVLVGIGAVISCFRARYAPTYAGPGSDVRTSGENGRRVLVLLAVGGAPVVAGLTFLIASVRPDFHRYRSWWSLQAAGLWWINAASVVAVAVSVATVAHRGRAPGTGRVAIRVATTVGLVAVAAIVAVATFVFLQRNFANAGNVSSYGSAAVLAAAAVITAYLSRNAHRVVAVAAGVLVVGACIGGVLFPVVHNFLTDRFPTSVEVSTAIVACVGVHVALVAGGYSALHNALVGYFLRRRFGGSPRAFFDEAGRSTLLVQSADGYEFLHPLLMQHLAGRHRPSPRLVATPTS